MRLLIVGNGIAGVTTARMVAESDSSIQITVYSDEPFHYYSRPRLVDYVGGRIDEEKLVAFSEDWYSERGIDVRLGTRVLSIDTGTHSVTLADGTTDRYDRLVLAIGATARMPPIPGSEGPGVHTLRTLEDARAIRAVVARKKRVLIVGGGLLGLEIAAAFADCDMEVIVAEIAPRILPRQLDVEGAHVLQHRIERRGVSILTNESCGAIQHTDNGKRVTLSQNGLLDVDMVAVSAGVVPNVGLAREACLDCNRGIVVDDHLLTSTPDVYAVGDVAEYEGITWGIIPAALAQARTAAEQILGKSEALYEDIVPSTTLKVTGVDVTSIGDVNSDDPEVVEIRSADLEEGQYAKLVLRQGRVVGAIYVGSRARVRATNLLISKQVDVSSFIDSLLDEEFDLLALASRSA